MQSKEAKMVQLQEERDFFKNEAFRLDKVWKEFQKKYKTVKSLYDNTTNEKNFMLAQLK